MARNLYFLGVLWLLTMGSTDAQMRFPHFQPTLPRYMTHSPRPVTVKPLKCGPDTCKLPDCLCASTAVPGGLRKSEIPQIVMFTFDDAINEQIYDYYEDLFPARLLNPNGCPVSVTFFLSNNWTDYSMVKELYLRGHEIGSHSITHRMPQSWWTYASYKTVKKEMSGQRENIVQKAAIPRTEIRGLRMPFLENAGDEQFEMMRDEGFEYDATFMTGPHPEGGIWPHTLAFPNNYRSLCDNNNCPSGNFSGIWEVPLNFWRGPSGGVCSMVDACPKQPTHKGEALSYLWQNFNRHYYGNKSPVGVNMHAVWFNTKHHLDAMREFVNTLAAMEDVYIITVHQTVEWMRTPKRLNELKGWTPWGCEGRRRLVKMVPRTKQSPPTSTSPPLDADRSKSVENADREVPVRSTKKTRRKGGRQKERGSPSRAPAGPNRRQRSHPKALGREGSSASVSNPVSTVLTLFTAFIAHCTLF